MEQLGGPTGGSGRQVAGLDQPDTQTAGHSIQRAAAAGNTGTDDKDVEVVISQPVKGVCSGRRSERVR